MTEELFDVVDQQDRVLHQAPRSLVHASRWLHRASHIFVFNTRGELLEGGRSSVFVRVDDRWLTPPLSADILPGVMRAVVLEEGGKALGAPGESVEEGVITRAMLGRADAVVVVNALRGAMPATLR